MACCACECGSRPASQNSIDRELEDLHREIQNLTVLPRPPLPSSSSSSSLRKPRRHSDTSVWRQGAPPSAQPRSRSFPDAATTRLQVALAVDSSSAYNTGDSEHNNSSRNSPLGDAHLSLLRLSAPADASPTPTPSGGWRVKRRSDGSRYVTRKPGRSLVLKQREWRLLEERCGATTDDDALSEMKAGRHWSREERKRHLVRARERRRRREDAASRPLREQEAADNVPGILELSRRKQSFKDGKNFDDFVTVQEMMVHGSRGAHRYPYRHLLSVTTV
ncbi:PREDICTED: PDZ domain-containing protein 4-like [Priapulus caudatus]|uniref:PDZ domain-containing protein 4-like n=1 Tax=Priapulus caudatus TaxID=37621 RepID=A0ABM1F1Y5_PRICU|nr:PREDICTED: PDZ domain-containing protein 4-like [Priapulus caudatus]